MVDIYVPVVAAVISVIAILTVVLFVLLCWYLRRRRALCFSRRRDGRPFLVYDKEVEMRLRKALSSKDRKRLRQQSDGAEEAISAYDRAPQSDPFTVINPMGSIDQLDSPWDNPAFDREQARLRDVAIFIQSWWRMIKQRTAYLELRRTAILCQSLYRARKVRKMLPQWKAEKQLKDQQKRKLPGWKKKGSLAALKFFDVKGFGFAQVEQLYGIDTVREAAEQLKNLYGSKGKMRLKLFISVKGIKLFDANTLELFATVNISSVSFCTLDPKNPKIFAFINRKKKKNFCHVFQCHEGHAQKMVETTAEAFEVTLKKVEAAALKKTEEENEILKNARLRKQHFHHKSQELDAEVASMMEMAERASMHTPMLDRASVHSYNPKDDRHSISLSTPLVARSSLPKPLDSSPRMLHIAETHGMSDGFSSQQGSRTTLSESKGNLATRKSQSNMASSNLLNSTIAPPQSATLSETVDSEHV